MQFDSSIFSFSTNVIYQTISTSENKDELSFIETEKIIGLSETSETDNNPLEDKIWEPEPGADGSTSLESLFFADSNFNSSDTQRPIQKPLTFSILEQLSNSKGFVKKKDVVTSRSAEIQLYKLIHEKYIEKNENGCIKITESGIERLNKLRSLKIEKEPRGNLTFTILEILDKHENFVKRNVIPHFSSSVRPTIHNLIKKRHIVQNSDKLIKITQLGRNYFTKLKNNIPVIPKQKRPLEENLHIAKEPPKKKQKADQESRNVNRAFEADPMVIEDHTVPVKIEDTIGHQSARISGIYVLRGENSSLRESNPKLTPFAQQILIYLAEINQPTTVAKLRSKFGNDWSFASETSILYLRGLGYIIGKDEDIQITPKGFYILQQFAYEDHQ